MRINAIRTSVIVSVFLLCAAPAQGRANHWAQNGALDVFYASSGEQGLLSVNLFHLAGGYSNEIYGHDYSAIGFAPFSFLEFSSAIYVDGFRRDENYYRVGPILLSPALKAGQAFYLNQEKGFFVAPGLVVLGRFATASVWTGDSTSVSAPPPSVDFTGILGIGYDIFKFHINAGYGIFTTSGIASIPWGVAVEVSVLEFLDVIVEATDRSPSGDVLALYALQVTPAVRLNFPSLSWLIMDIAAPIGIGSDLYLWKVELGVSAAFDLIKPPAEPKARVQGRVISEETANPIAAKLVFPESDVAPVMTDSVAGEYSLELAPGVYRIRAESPGYKWKEKGVVLQDKEEKVLDFALAKAKDPRAYISGTVKDAETNEAIEGVTVSFGRVDMPLVVTDALGIFKTTLLPDDYLLTFSMEGYQSQERSISLQDGDAREINVDLSPPKPEAPDEAPEFKNVLFNPGSAVIMTESYPGLEEVAEFLETYPTVRIEIQGHTDSVGDDEANMQLSQQRAEAVKTWLGARGIDESGMTARGYGETQPIGDNRTRSGQKANRRIQFVILSE
jgi:outer membrane protein OmpA-like peptidoglycan-associated protein